MLCILVLQSTLASAQSANTDYLQRLKLNQAFDPPQDILSSKSLVLISAPAGVPNGEWKEKADELQAFFAEVGIDAVAYFNVDRQWALPGEVSIIPQRILDRKITNLVFVIMGGENQPSVIGIGPFNGKSTFYDASATFWTREFNELEGIFSELDGLFKTGAFTRTNLLVNESAEFFDMTRPRYAANYASFPPELQTRKIAVPLLKPYPSGVGSHLLSSNHFNNPTQNREVTSIRNGMLDALVADSIFNAARVDMSQTTEALMRRDGFTHVLQFVAADSEFIYKLFKYKNREETEAPFLVKFYLKDLRNKNIFLGRSWDASTDWKEALDNFVAQMKKELPQEGG